MDALIAPWGYVALLLELEIATYLSKMHLVKDNLVRMPDAPKARDEGEGGHDGDGKPVVPFAALRLRLVRLDLLDDIGHLLGQCFWVWRHGSLLVFACSLADAASG